jgi:cell division protein FtsW
MSHHRLIVFLTLGLTFFGLVMIGSASFVDASRDFGDQWYYLKLQSFWAVIGLIFFWFSGKFNHLKLQALATPFFLVTIILLFAVLLPGIGVQLQGARRWLNFGFFLLQPSEIAKLTMSIYYAAMFVHKPRLIPFITTLGLVCFLVILEPDLGTALVILGSGAIIFFGAGGKIRDLAFFAVLGIILILLLVTVSPYRTGRLKSYFNPSQDPLGSSYQIRQALIAFGSGNIFGLGLGQSRQKYDYLPEATTDSIFAIIGEELGLIGAVTIVIVYLMLFFHGLKVSAIVKNKFSANLALGLTSVIALQTFINISAITALIPLTGIPLTYISYGGSSLLIMLVTTGILVNISRGL